jgi:hypothetical protein
MRLLRLDGRLLKNFDVWIICAFFLKILHYKRFTHKCPRTMQKKYLSHPAQSAARTAAHITTCYTSHNSRTHNTAQWSFSVCYQHMYVTYSYDSHGTRGRGKHAKICQLALSSRSSETTDYIPCKVGHKSTIQLLASLFPEPIFRMFTWISSYNTKQFR